MASPVYIWFRSEVFPWRNIAATCWILLCLPFLLLLLMLLSQLSIIEPFSWAQGFLNSVLSLHFVFMLVIYALTLMLMSWFSLPYLTVVPVVESTQLSCYIHLLKWARLPLLVICSLCGAVCSWCVVRLMGNDVRTLTYVLDTPEYKRIVLNENHLFLILCGIFTGLGYYNRFFLHSKNHLTFPHIQRFKFFRIRSEAVNLLQITFWQSLHTVKYFVLFYFFFGGIPKAWIQISFNIDADPGVSPLNSILGLLSVTLMWRAYLSTQFITFTWNFAITLIKIYQTLLMEFPVTSVMEESCNTLPNAMACSYSQLLQHLAFYDLSSLAKFSPARRQEMLSLSQPGGHPRIWTAVSGTALSVVRELIDRIREENSTIVSRITVSSQQEQPFNTADSTTFTTYFRGRSAVPAQAEVSSVLKEDNKAPSIFTKVTTTVSNFPVVSYMLSSNPDANTLNLFSACQLQIWAVEGLSHIASKSYKEDKYGVVQGNLSAIFSALLDLHEVIEKHFKLTPSLSRISGGQGSDIDTSLPYKLQSVNKAAIYRLVDTYKEHLEDLRLGPDYFRRLQPFSDFSL